MVCNDPTARWRGFANASAPRALCPKGDNVQRRFFGEKLRHRMNGMLSEGPDHHRTIEATIAWSYDLLDEDTKKLLRFLSVFEGGFDLEQDEAVDGEGTFDRLEDLVRKSLVQRVDHRFGMLEAVRQYAAVSARSTLRRLSCCNPHVFDLLDR